jgi:hypothetical protein
MTLQLNHNKNVPDVDGVVASGVYKQCTVCNYDVQGKVRLSTHRNYFGRLTG